MPIYNVEDYLQECLESIANQSAADRLEVILIDDGSTDSSGEIAQQYSDKYEHFKLITQNNAGLGAARNRGVDEARTPYVMFCDSDDRLPATAVGSLLAGLVGNDADIAIGKMQSFPNRTSWPWLKYFEGTTKVVEGIEFAPDLIHGASVCNKIFRLSDLRARKLRFAEGAHFEDVYVSIPLLLSASRIALVPDVVYEYRKRAIASSIMDSLWTRENNYWDHLRVEEFVAKLLLDLSPERRSVAELFMVRSFQGFLRRAPLTISSDDDLRSFFGRAVSAFTGISASSIQAGCLDGRHRLPFLALLSSNFDFFKDPQAHTEGIFADEGKLRISLSVGLSDDLRNLAVADRVVAYLEAVELLPRAKGLRVSGRYNVDGFEPKSGPPAKLGVRVRGSGLTAAAQPLLRRSHDSNGDVLTWSGFVADIPASRLRDGEHRLRLVFETPTGQASTRLRATVGLKRSSRVSAVSGRHVTITSDRFDNSILVSRRTDTRVRKVRWRVSQIRADLTHILHRRPMWRDRLLRLVTAPVLRRRNIWLLVERRDTAQDNSYFLFRHLRTKERDRRAYFVISKDSAQKWKLRGLGHVVHFGSLRHRVLLLNAMWLIGSYDIDSYVLPRAWNRGDYLRYLAPRIGSRRAFLQHGVTYNDVSHALHCASTGVDLFVTSSEEEARFVRDEMCYPSRTVVSGLPRFDSLHRVDGASRILLMPTWRSWLTTPSYASRRRDTEAFDDSRYFRFFADLLNHEGLQSCLRDFGAELEILPHYEFADLFGELIPKHTSMFLSHHANRDVQQALRECSIFVTDWSSTFFDAAYLGVPQVLIPFDEDEFRQRHYRKGYFDLERDGFGPVARTVDEAVEAIVAYVHRGYQREEVYNQRAKGFFAYQDCSNCARVVAAIDRASTLPRALPPPAAWGVSRR